MTPVCRICGKPGKWATKGGPVEAFALRAHVNKVYERVYCVDGHDAWNLYIRDGANVIQVPAFEERQ